MLACITLGPTTAGKCLTTSGSRRQCASAGGSRTQATERDGVLGQAKAEGRPGKTVNPVLHLPRCYLCADAFVRSDWIPCFVESQAPHLLAASR